MSKQHPTLLIIEDEELLQQAITRKLQLKNIKTISFGNGREAIEYLTKTEELPDAVWLDYYLKDMNGLEFMQSIKQNPHLAQIPVVVVSNSANVEKVHNMLALGAKKYLLKADYRLEDIINSILSIIEENSTIATDHPRS